jgi:hypothetical protein
VRNTGFLVRGAVWGELVSGRAFPDLWDFSGNIVILDARIAADPVRVGLVSAFGHANSLNKK